jgi:radical SAM superfamily enzyme YgiQ (UPF0313 family)
MSCRVALLFPPGWTLSTGAPHLSLASLKASLIQNGIVDVSIHDLNQESAARWISPITSAGAEAACTGGHTLAAMNEPYFAAEDRLMSIARRFGGKWNAQLGFWYDSHPERSSRTAFEYVLKPSPFDSYVDVFLPDLLAERPEVIGLCLASVYQIVPSLKLSRELRGRGYHGLIVLGGNTVSRLATELAIPAVFELVDGLVTFQGEIPLLRLCQAVSSKRSLASVPQMIWNDGGEIRFNDFSEFLDPLTLTEPNYEGLNVGEYWGHNYLNVVAARGCYYGKCQFCAIPYGWGNDGFAGVRPPNLMVRDIAALLDKHQLPRFKFVDEAMSPRFMVEFSKELLQAGLSIEWEGYVRLERAWCDPAFVSLVARAGFRKGYFGLEFVQSESRNLLHKSDHADPEPLLRLCRAHGIKVHLFCMFGFPGTGRQEADRTIEFLLEHQESIDTADIFPFTYAKHTIVPAVNPILDPEQDWSIEYAHAAKPPYVLSSEAVAELAAVYEERIWREVPRLLHPTYRLVSPWISSSSKLAPSQRERDFIRELV